MSKQNPVEVLEFKLDAMRSILADQSDSGPIHEDVYRVRRALSGMSAIAFNILRNPQRHDHSQSRPGAGSGLYVCV